MEISEICESMSDLRAVSRDKNNDCSMIDSDFRIVNFDNVKAKWAKKRQAVQPLSADALMDSGNVVYFVEFKNADCSRKTDELVNKFLSSLVIVADLCGE